MIGFDTNVVLRIVGGDDVAQQKTAVQFLRKHCSESSPAWLNRVVVVEFVWVLESNGEYSRSRIADMLERLLHTAELQFEDHDQIRDAVTDYRAGADFADALIARGNEAAGCVTTMTFDHQAAKRLAGMRRF